MLHTHDHPIVNAIAAPSSSGQRLATNTAPPSISLCEDVLFIIFDQFDTSDAASRADCAGCARVCHLWSEPALRALWKSLKSGLLPLYWILLPEPTSALMKQRHSAGKGFLDTFVPTSGFVLPQERTELSEYFHKILHQLPSVDLATWKRFLRYSSYVQRLDHWQGFDHEQPLLHALMVRNDQKTFLPNLRSLTWVETPDYDGILALLAPPSLAWLELRVQANALSGQVEKAIYALSLNAPFLSHLRVHSENPGFQPPMSGFQRLRSLIIHNSVTRPDLTSLTPSCRQTLRDLRYSPEGFAVSPDDTTGCLALPNLRSLQLFGPPTDRMCAFITYLRAPDLSSLDLELRDHTGQPSNSTSLSAQTALFRAISEASFAPALRHLALTVQTKANLGTDPTAAGGAGVMSAMRPLFSLSALRVLTVVYFCGDATLGTDADMLAAATAWRDMEHLSLDFPFSDVYDQGGFPSLASLAHIAAHCPRLTWLRIPLAVLDPPPEPETTVADLGHGQHGEGTAVLPRASSHPLRTLEVQVRQWGNGMEPEMVARRIDGLFPSLERDGLRFRYPIRPRIAPRRYQARWDSMIAAWKDLRAAREVDVRDA